MSFWCRFWSFSASHSSTYSVSNLSYNRSKFWCFFSVVFAASWVSFGLSFGSILAPNRAKFCQNASWTFIFVKNADFHETLWIPIQNGLFGGRDGSQNALRSPQDVPKKDSELLLFVFANRLRFRIVLKSIWMHFASPNASLLASFSRSKSIQKSFQNRIDLGSILPPQMPPLELLFRVQNRSKTMLENMEFVFS